MEYIWVPITLFAAIVQTGRNGLIKHLKKDLPDKTILFARFAVSAPFAILWLSIFLFAGYELPDFNLNFLKYALLACLAQIAGGLLFLTLFSRRNFVIGVTYAKTEAILAALFGALILSDYISFGALCGIIVGFAGIVFISAVEKHVEPTRMIRKIFSKSAAIGVGSGAFFGLTAIFIRQATLELQNGEYFVRAAYTLAFMLSVQSLITLVIFFYKDISQIKKMVSVKRKVLMLGFANSISSLCWFIAFSLTKAAYVSMMGQAEILFAIFLTHNFFKEKINKLEIMGIMLVLAGVLMLIYFH